MKEIFQSKLFRIGLLLKVLCLFVFASPFPRDLFIPFLDSAVKNFGTNPWTLNPPHFFPYGGFLFLILFIPKWILYSAFGDLALGTSPLSLFALKFPLLCVDMLFFVTLTKFARERWRDLVALFWLNPVLFYITYVHVQLDVVSMMLVAASLLLLLEKRVLLSAVMMALATTSKFHVVAAAPIVLFYIWKNYFKKEAIKKIAEWVGTWIVISIAGFYPIIEAHTAGSATLGSPELQRLLAAKLELGDSTKIYLGVIVTMLILGRIMISTRITELGLVFGVGAVFSGLVFSSHAATGWFYWSIPFIALFFSLYMNVPRTLFWFLNIMYILVYATQELYGEILQWPDLIWNVLYTGLQTSLLANIVAMWVVALRQEAPLVKSARPIRIGLAGDSGSGKNTLTESLRDIFGERNLTIIEGDNYHKWERGDDQWQKYTHLNPKANHLFALSQHFSRMSQGRPVFHSIYSHETGKFTAPIEFKPSKTLVVQGLHTFYLRTMRELFDLKIFLAPHPLVRTAWKIQRDCIQRGYDKDKVLSQLQDRGKDSENFINTQKEHADLIIECLPAGEFSEKQAEEGWSPRLQVRYTAWNDTDLSIISRELDRHGIKSQLTIDPKAIDRVVMTVESEPSKDAISQISRSLFVTLRPLTRGYDEPRFKDGFAGLSQLVVLWILNAQLLHKDTGS